MKFTCITIYNYIVHCTIKTRAQLVRRYKGKRTSEKSEVLTYKDATQVVRYRCVNQQAKEVNSRAIFLLIAVRTNLCGGIDSLYCQTNKHKYESVHFHLLVSIFLSLILSF